MNFFFTTLLTIIIVLNAHSVFAQFAGGSGIETDPYQISTVEQLQEIENYPDKHFIQINDIDASTTLTWNNGKGFNPIGTDSAIFSGLYNGADYKISGLTINRESEDHVGLFGYADGATIKQVVLIDASVKGSNDTGILIGYRTRGQIIDIQVSGSVTGRAIVGGLVGFNYGEIKESCVHGEVSGYSNIGGLAGFNRGEIDDSYAAADVSGTGTGIGGLVGNNYDGSIIKSYARGNVLGSRSSSFGGLVGSNGGEIIKSYAQGEVSGRSYVGGLVGFNRGEIKESYAIGSISGTGNGMGGLVGNNYGGKITSSYANGNVAGPTQVGGFVGVNGKGGIISASYTTSLISGNSDVGGFIGVNKHPVANGFWNMQSSNQSQGVGSGPADGITGLNTPEMTGLAGKEKLAGFAFNTVWGSIPDDYPRLLWNIPYFHLELIETDAPIISGQLLSFEVALKNIGGLSGTNTLVLKDKEGTVVESIDSLEIESGEERRLFFEWQSTKEDKGKYEFTFETQHVQEAIIAQVRFTPSVVELNEPTDVEEQVELQPVFSWNEATFAENYQLQIAEDVNFESIVHEIDGFEKLSYTLSKQLSYFSTYLWRVRAKNSEETGDWSKILSFTTIKQKPEIVQLFQQENEPLATSSFPALTWSTSERAENYILQLAKNDDFKEIEFDTTFTAPDTTFKFENGLEPEAKFFWRVQAYNEGGTSEWSEVNSFITSESISTESNFAPVEFTLEQNYPNPFNPVTYIRYGISEASEVHLEVLTMLGQNVATLVNERKSAGWHTATFDASELSSGFYIYRITANDFVDTKKLMLIK
ncbi:MAG: GLUG motif-containing protein [Balneolaceae bacterium]